MPKEELTFEAGVGVCKGTALGLEDGADALGDDVEPSKEVVVCQSIDVFRVGERLLEAGTEGRRVSISQFVESDEHGGCGDPSGGRGEPVGGQDFKGKRQEGSL